MDSFHPEHSHVIPAVVRKMIEANFKNEGEVVVWGTGRPSREFLYVEDAAEGILLATEKYNEPDPVNLGTGKEIQIRDLVHLIGKLAGFQGKIIWDRSRPDGQPRRCLDVKKAREKFGFEAKTDLTEGLRRTIEWYRDQLLCPVTEQATIRHGLYEDIIQKKIDALVV
jgi:GDP-L-fucose synthase